MFSSAVVLTLSTFKQDISTCSTSTGQHVLPQHVLPQHFLPQRVLAQHVLPNTMITKVATHLLDLSSAIGLESEGLLAGAVPLLLSRTTSTPRTNVGCAK